MLLKVLYMNLNADFVATFVTEMSLQYIEGVYGTNNTFPGNSFQFMVT